MNRKIFELYGITDGSENAEARVEAAIRGGVTLIQYRDKNTEDRAYGILQVCRKYGIPLIINDNTELAAKIGADGVHLGTDDMPVSEARKILGENAIIGATAKTLEQALKAAADGADYIGCGAVFPSGTKKDAVRISVDDLKKICEKINIPVVAVGGINAENISGLQGIKIAGAAVSEGIFGQNDTEAAAVLLKQRVKTTAGTLKTALTIAGSDSGGGAGIQADIKTMTAHGVYAMSAVTSLTAQNTLGVKSIFNVEGSFLADELDCIFTDIYPDAVKIGMMSNEKLIHVASGKLKEYRAENVVLDPVMVSTGGSRLLEESAVNALISELMPSAAIITPNIPEAEIISGMKINGSDDMVKAGKRIYEMTGTTVLIKGGHSINDADDVLVNEKIKWFYGKKVNNSNTHGTGCTLSSAIASNLALGKSVEEAVSRAKKYVSDALRYGLDLGKGPGPLYHMVNVEK